MNILMITPVHPSTPHISGVRAWRFAQELARRGHRVVLLTATADEVSPGMPQIPEYHDWSHPAIVALPNPRSVTGDARPGALTGKLRTAMHMLRHGGRSGAWVNRAVRAATHLDGGFRPDVVWCTFGMLEAVVAARSIATAVRCPWVLDVKDNWELYVPQGMRRIMAWRIGGFSQVTANAQLTAAMTWRWLRRQAEVVYSGVESEFYPAGDTEPVASTFAINLVGSIYFPPKLAEFMNGLGAWIATLDQSQRSEVLIRYLGGDVEDVAAAAARLPKGIHLELAGYRPIAEMARLCRTAAVNTYIAHPATFHHKLLELLATGRPILAYPSERREAIDLAARMGDRLILVDSKTALFQAIARLHAEWKMNPDPARKSPAVWQCTWPQQTLKLEQVLLRAAGQSGTSP